MKVTHPFLEEEKSRAAGITCSGRSDDNQSRVPRSIRKAGNTARGGTAASTDNTAQQGRPMAQRLRLCLPVQGLGVRCLVGELSHVPGGQRIKETTHSAIPEKP